MSTAKEDVMIQALRNIKSNLACSWAVQEIYKLKRELAEAKVKLEARNITCPMLRKGL